MIGEVLAKRFTDTGLHRKKWFRDSPPHIQSAYRIILAECDHAGVWDIDLEILSIYSKGNVTLSELFQHVNSGKERIKKVDDDKIWVTGFCAFQYGKLSEGCPPHRPVLSRLRGLSLTLPFQNPIETLSERVQEKEEEKVKEKDKEKVKDQEKENPEKIIQISHLINIWGDTLKHFKINKDPKLDDMAIMNLLTRYGFQKASLALQGSRYEARSDSFDPSKHISIARLKSNPTHFEKMVNLGAQDQNSVAENKNDYSFLKEKA